MRKEEQHIRDKKYELIWALDDQDYSLPQIAVMFNIHRSSVMRIIKKKPKGWKPKWVKA